jgi:hypothetical protein
VPVIIMNERVMFYLIKLRCLNEMSPAVAFLLSKTTSARSGAHLLLWFLVGIRSLTFMAWKMSMHLTKSRQGPSLPKKKSRADVAPGSGDHFMAGEDHHS